MGDLDFEIWDILWIAPEQSEVLEEGECELRTFKIEDNKWAVIMSYEFKERYTYSYLTPFFQKKKSLLPEFFRAVAY